MEQLTEALKISLATAFSLYLKAHNFHWNVTGPNFSEYHEFFGEFYENVFSSVDLIAEHIRTLDEFVPGSCTRFAELSKIQDQLEVLAPEDMFRQLFADNETMLSVLYAAHTEAEKAKKFGIINFLEDRIDFHDKMHWMIRAFMVKVVGNTVV